MSRFDPSIWAKLDTDKTLFWIKFHIIHIMKTPRPLARWDKIRGGDSLDYYTIDELDDEEYGDDEYEYYEVDEDDEADDAYEEYEEEPSSVEKATVPKISRMSKVKGSIVIPKAISIKAITPSLPKLSVLQHNLITNSRNLSMEVVKFLTVHAYASASIGASALCLLLVQIVLTRTKVFPGITWGRRRKSAKKKKAKKKKKYGDYSKGYPDEDDVVDLDEKSSKKNGVLKRFLSKATNAMFPTSLVYWFDSVSFSVGTIKSRMGMKLANAMSFIWKKNVSVDSRKGELKATAKLSAAEEVDVGSAATDLSSTNESSLKEAEMLDELQQQINTLTDSHQSLEQEYEASLRMLHEARLELRQLKQQTSSTDEESQKEQMESTIKELEIKYKQQMKDQIERLKNQTTEKIRAELSAKYEEKFRAQTEQLDLERKQYEDEFLSSPAFQRHVDEASAVKIEEAVANAVEETIAQQQAKSREEMARVRKAIQKVLERERRMMKEQVSKATSQVREWVKRQQLEQLQRREEQLRGEARELGFLEEQQEEIDVDEDDEDVALAGDVVDRRVVGRRDSSRREENKTRYTGSSLYDERRRGVEQRRRNASRSARRAEPVDNDPRGNYYPERSGEFYDEEDDRGMAAEENGDASEMDEEIPRERAPQQQKSSRYTSSNIYREAAKRKQQQQRRDREI